MTAHSSLNFRAQLFDSMLEDALMLDCFVVAIGLLIADVVKFVASVV